MKTLNKPFTIQDGIAIQQEQVEAYTVILNDFAMNALRKKCEEENKKPMKDGYSVFRGSDISCFLQNLKRK